MRFPLVLLLVALSGPAPLPATAVGGGSVRGGESPQDGNLEELEAWLDDFRRNGPQTSPENVARLSQLTSDLRMIALTSPSRRPAVVLGLLDVAGVRSSEEVRVARRTRGISPPAPQTRRVRALGERELRALMNADSEETLPAWLAANVLASSSQPADRRLAAVRLLDSVHAPSTRLALFGCAVDEDSRELRELATSALVGWDDDGVHTFMLGQLERQRVDSEWVTRSSIRRHFASVSLDPRTSSGRAIYAMTRSGMVSPDWREAFRALQLIVAVRDDPAVPALIDGLALWIDRRENDIGSRRIENEIVQELQRRSGRRIGAHPDRWRQWWRVTSEKLGSPEDQEERATETTWAGFFGLRPVTDRVVFVIDRSRSMRQPFGDQDMTRYSAAIEQMTGFLRELGPQTRFRVVVFSAEFDSWKDRLQPATKANLRSAERWLRYRTPEGGTFLEPAIRHVLRLDDEGRPDLSRLEADTVIVLCDGETAEGPGWVSALLEGPNEEAALAFHSVLIGGDDDGTLPALAAGSGGDFVKVIP